MSRSNFTHQEVSLGSQNKHKPQIPIGFVMPPRSMPLSQGKANFIAEANGYNEGLYISRTPAGGVGEKSSGIVNGYSGGGVPPVNQFTTSSKRQLQPAYHNPSDFTRQFGNSLN